MQNRANCQQRIICLYFNQQDKVMFKFSQTFKMRAQNTEMTFRKLL